MFHLCSHGSRNARRGEEPWLEGPYALRQWLPAGDVLHAPLRLPKAAGPRDACCYARAELPAGEARGAFDVPCVRESEGDGGL
jgi:hypothetical protein